MNNENGGMSDVTESHEDQIFLGGVKWSSLDQLISNPDVIGMKPAIEAQGSVKNAMMAEILSSDHEGCLRVVFSPLCGDDAGKRFGINKDIEIPSVGIRRYGKDFKNPRKLSEDAENAVVSYLLELGFTEDSKPDEFENLRCFSLKQAPTTMSSNTAK